MEREASGCVTSHPVEATRVALRALPAVRVGEAAVAVHDERHVARHRPRAQHRRRRATQRAANAANRAAPRGAGSGDGRRLRRVGRGRQRHGARSAANVALLTRHVVASGDERSRSVACSQLTLQRYRTCCSMMCECIKAPYAPRRSSVQAARVAEEDADVSREAQVRVVLGRHLRVDGQVVDVLKAGRRHVSSKGGQSFTKQRTPPPASRCCASGTGAPGWPG